MKLVAAALALLARDVRIVLDSVRQ